MLKRHTLAYLFAYGVPAVVGFGALIIYSHLILPSEYGIYVIGQSVAGIISAIFFGWIRLSISRYQPGGGDWDVRGAALMAYLSTLVVILGLAFAAAPFIPAAVDYRLAIASLFLAVCLSGFEITQEFRRATLKPLPFMLVAVMRSVFAFAFGVTVVLMGGGGIGLLTAIAASFLLVNLIFAGSSWRLLFSIREWPSLRRFAHYGMPLAVAGLAFAFYATLDRLAVAYFIGDEATGRYGIASDLARQIIIILASSVASAIFPMAFRSLETAGAAITHERLEESLELLVAIVAPVAVWLAVSADVLAGTIIGKEFGPSVAILLPILVIARLFGAITHFYVHLSFQLAEKPMLQLINETAILVLYILLMTVLIHEFGLTGAAIAVLVAEVVGFLFGVWLTRFGFPLPLAVPRLARIAASLVLMAAASYAAKYAAGESAWFRLVGALSAGVGTYGLACLAFNVAGIRNIALRYWRHGVWQQESID